ncbi:hypothetical protein PU634_05115 [Oceanimonas pelagia]|uniref:Uncharacterized protein n=1 Tax=Oceanimonas pelagia TaxID=3028314 RepID=A0AA50KR58_9GAMM|nr:hypothetical protein [Oceanimonas pelagia]WMC11748.1 hypothetical protein PU634_05115 [Oceanimonas pelagia]
MLTNVPAGINSVARNVIINHPNTFNCEVYRRTVQRTGPEEGGMPTLGGMMVLTVEDEENIGWELVGLGFALSAEAFLPSSMVDRRDASYGGLDEFRFLVEPEHKLGDPGGFEVKKNDVIYLIVGQGDTAAKIAHEIVDVESTVNVPPFVPRFVTNRRADLDLMPGDPGIEP